MIKKNKVFIVIPVFNKLELTKKCLRSISIQNYQNIEIVIVDANSSDNTVSYISNKYPLAKIIQGKSTWWWTRSMFEGVKYSLGRAKPNDFILTMNNDCFFKENYLNSLVRCALNNSNSIVGSMVVDAENKKYVMDAGVLIDWSKANIYNHTKLTSNNLLFYKNKKVNRNLDTLPGKGTLIPINVFEKIGNFNYKQLPHYIGDYEFFCRAKNNNFKLIVSCDEQLYNYKKETGSSHLPQHKSNYKEAIGILFNRKSKLNIVDHVNFLILCCPRQYLYTNLKQVYRKLLNYMLMIFPFYYLKIIMHLYHQYKYKVKIFTHNLPIYIKQNYFINKLKLYIHNGPIFIKQLYIKKLGEFKLHVLYYQNKDNLSKTCKMLIFNRLLNRPFKFKDWDNNLYYQYPTDRVNFNIKRNAVSDSINITNLVKRVIKKNFVCVDIGACIGATSIPMWKKLYSKGSVYSIEADPNNINIIKKNLSLNDFSTDFVFNFAIYKSNQKIKLNVIKGINGWQSLGNPKLDSTINQKLIKTKIINTVTLESFCKTNKIEDIDFLKIDVEGGELDVFCGANNLLKNKKIKLLAFEISPQMLRWHKLKPLDVIQSILSYDYKLFKINIDGTLTKLKNNYWPENQHGDCLAISDIKYLL